MRVVVQRVSSAKVVIETKATGAIDQGLLVLLGIAKDDTPDDATWLVRKIVELRIFPDDEGRMNRSVREISGGVLLVSQFTLIASTRKGTRPSFNEAARPETAIPLYEQFHHQLESELGRPVPTGRFGASMSVELCNDGPVTLVIDSRIPE